MAYKLHGVQLYTVTSTIVVISRTRFRVPSLILEVESTNKYGISDGPHNDVSQVSETQWVRPSVRPSSKIQNLKVGVYIWGGECDFLDLKMMGGNSEKSENALSDLFARDFQRRLSI